MIYDFEHRSEPVLPFPVFMKRIGRGARLILLLVALSLTFGILGYRLCEHMPWIDALLNAAMIMGGMGPVDTLHSTAGKLFASFYAVFSGMFLIAVTGILLAPVFHRILHKFHADTKFTR